MIATPARRAASTSYGVSPIMIASRGAALARFNAAWMMSGAGFDSSASSEEVAASITESAPAILSSALSSSFFAELAATAVSPRSFCAATRRPAVFERLNLRQELGREDFAAALRDLRAEWGVLLQPADLRHQLVAAHADAAPHVPELDRDAGLRECLYPRMRMCVVAVDQRAVNVEQHSFQGVAHG